MVTHGSDLTLNVINPSIHVMITSEDPVVTGNEYRIFTE